MKTQFEMRDLGVYAYTNGLTIWAYKAGTIPLAAIKTPGFFADAAAMMARGDMIMVSSDEGGTIRFVIRADDGVVDTASLI